MFCQNAKCGLEISGSYKICPQCGGKVFGAQRPGGIVSPGKAAFPQHAASQRTRSLGCPQCAGQVLQSAKMGDVGVDVCRKCGGLWFQQGELCRVLAQSVSDGSGGTNCELHQLGGKLEDTSCCCPECGGRLAVYNLSEVVQLEVHACEKCRGLWFEPGEVEHATLLEQHEKAMLAIDRERTWKDWFFQLLLSVPVEFNMKPRSFPKVTVGLITACALVFLLGTFSILPQQTIESGAFLPASFPDISWFVSLLSYQFLHANLLHLVGNMYFLYLFGDNLEDVLGWRDYLILYLAAGAVGALTHQGFTAEPEVVLVGASGAVAGLMAAYMVIFRRAKLTVMLAVWQFKVPALWYCGGWVLLNMAGQLLGQGAVSWGCHLGGFAVGVFAALMLRDRVYSENPILSLLEATKPPRETSLSTGSQAS